MAINLSDNIQTSAPKPTDSRYLNNLVPYASVSAANAAITGGVGGVRYTGLTVNIMGVEYWYCNGIGDANLVIKDSGVANTGITTAINGLTKVGTSVRLGGTLTGSTIITDSRATPLGIQYAADYCNTFTARSIPDAGYVTGKTLAALGNYYTKAQINSYTASTLTNINSRLLITTFNTFTGTTLPTNFYNKTQINSYTGQTLTNINSRALQSNFVTHTGNTSIHYVQSAITITESQVTNLPIDLANLQTQIDQLSQIQTTTIYYPEHDDSDVVGYETLKRSPDSTTGHTHTVAINNNTVQVGAWITSPGDPGVTGITSGLWTLHTHAQWSSTTGVNNLHWDVYKRTTGGTETFLFRVSTPDISTTALVEYQESIVYSGTTMNPSDRLVLKILAQTTGGAKNASIQFGGTLNFAFMQPPILSNMEVLWSSIQGKPAWLTGTTLGAFEAGHSHSQYALQSAINTFTGTTLPANYYNKTQINSYTGQTDTRLDIVEADYITGVTNGLTKVGAHDACLGGALIANTCISGAFLLGVNVTNINFTGTTVNIGGIVKLTTSLSAGTTNDSVLVRATDGTVKSIAGSTFGDKNNIYSYTAITTGVNLCTGSSYVVLVSPSSPLVVCLPATPVNGLAFKFKDILPGALLNNITICGSGKNIDGSPTALINTDYGALEIMYNGTNWFTLSFVN